MSCRNLDAGSLTVNKAFSLKNLDWIGPNNGYDTIGKVKARLMEYWDKSGGGFGNCIRVYKSLFDNWNNDDDAYVSGQSFLLTRIDCYEDSSYGTWIAAGPATGPIYIIRRFNGSWWAPMQLALNTINTNAMNQDYVIKQQMGGGITHFALGDYAVTVMQKGGQQHELQKR